MSQYYFVKTKKNKNGCWVLPRRFLYSKFTGPSNNRPFAVVKLDNKSSFNRDFDLDPPKYPDVKKVPDSLLRLLLSSETYPPAIALARKDIEAFEFSETITLEEYTPVCEGFFRKHLESQWNSNYVLAEVVVPLGIENFPGSFCWIVGFTPKINVVHFVSHDFWIYTDHTANFKLSQKQIDRLPIIEMKEYTIIDSIKKQGLTIDLTDEHQDFNQISEMIRIIR